MGTKSSKTESTTDRYGSTILGFIVVLVLGIFLFNVFRGNDTDRTGEVGDAGETSEQEGGSQADGKGTHTVAAGETLWDISVKEYNTGYNWQDIASANSLENADYIEEGTVLSIPDVTPIVPGSNASSDEGMQQPEQEQPEVITAPADNTSLPSDVTVQPGDTLWTIAVIVYGDGHQWSRIAEANNLDNPNVIHPGNLLVIPQ